MSKFKRYIVSSISFTVLLPALVVLTVVSGHAQAPEANRNFHSIVDLIRSEQKKSIPVGSKVDIQLTACGSISTDDIDDLKITVYVAAEKKNRVMNLEDYIMGVVYAEMPLTYGIEALKAQAVAARSFTLFKYYNEDEGVNIHKDGAVICTDYNHCQYWKDPGEILSAYGGDERAHGLYDKVKEAVKSTRGIVMTYEDEVIKAMYFSSSGGYTESMANVWAEDISYLQSVPSIGEIADDYYCSFKYFTNKDFVNRFKSKYGDSFNATSANVFSSIKDIERTESGRIKSMTIGDVNVSGTTVRSLLGVRSTNMVFRQLDDNTILVITIGSGHGVGMSQLGANTMAEQGKTYEEILKHYYTGIRVERELYSDKKFTIG